MIRYNANVRTGNWYDDLIISEEKAKQLLRKSKNKELRVQNTRRLFLAMLTEVPLTFPLVGLSYGAVIQLVSPELPGSGKCKLKENQGVALGADIDYKNVDKRCTFFIGDPVIGTFVLTPCVRNVWTLVPYERSREGTGLKFGDSFHIKLYKSDPPLYLQCEKYFPGTKLGESGHLLPTLIPYISSLTRFKVVHFNPKLRYETEGQQVPPFEKVAIVQGLNSEGLAVDPDTCYPTFFGLECEVILHTFRDNKDPYKPDPRNYWKFILSSG